MALQSNAHTVVRTSGAVKWGGGGLGLVPCLTTLGWGRGLRRPTPLRPSQLLGSGTRPEAAQNAKGKVGQREGETMRKNVKKGEDTENN